MINSEKYLSSFVFPFFSSLSLISFHQDDWIELANYILMLLKRIEMINIHSSHLTSFEFLECLLCQFLHSNTIKLSLDCPCDAIQNGLNEKEFANLLTNQQLNKYCNEKNIQETRKLCQLYEEWIEGESNKTKHFYSQLEKTCSIPSMIQRKYDKEIHQFCRLYFIFHIHNLSLSFL